MLTINEKIYFSRILQFCCKYLALSVPFTWNNERLDLKLKQGVLSRLYNILIWSTIFLALGFKITKVKGMLEKRDFRGLILTWIFLVKDSSHFFLKLNISMYRVELVRLINQVFRINSCWGEILRFIALTKRSTLPIIVYLTPNSELY